ncbi:MAG: polyprenyl diphosphate synthase [bacterium]
MPSNTLKFRRPRPRAERAPESSADTSDRASAESSSAALPRHIAVIMDGNGRWAMRHGLARIAGHRRGLETVKRVAPLVAQRGIPYLTLFAFSSENWRRPSAEVALLVELLEVALARERRMLHDNHIRLRVIGDLSRFPPRLQRNIADAVALTRDNAALHLTVAINYGGRWDLAQACRAVAGLVERGELPASAVTPAMVESQLCTRGLPEPDLFIRTGGEQRISNFLLWQLAYTELHFTDAHWPDFDEAELDRALRVFARRQRRFGKTSSQVAEPPA